MLINREDASVHTTAAEAVMIVMIVYTLITELLAS